jgi:hypothetical protein
METVFDNEFLTVQFDAEEKITVYTWKPATVQLNENTFLENCRYVLNIVLRERSRYVIGDARDFQFSFSKKASEIIYNEMLEKIGDFVLKYAHIETKNEEIRLAVEETFEETESELFQNRYFDDYDSAFTWISESFK